MKPEIDIVAEFANIVRQLDARQVPYAICGGFAVVIHGYVRATKDIDLLVEPQSVEPAMSALESIGFGLRAGPIPFGAGTTQERVLFRATRGRSPSEPARRRSVCCSVRRRSSAETT